jgi:hypothetical protein
MSDPTSKAQHTNLHFHLAMLGAVDLMGRVFSKPETLNNAARENTFPSPVRLASLWTSLQEQFEAFQRHNRSGPDKTAKSSEFVAFLTSNLGYGSLRRR